MFLKDTKMKDITAKNLRLVYEIRAIYNQFPSLNEVYV